MAVIILHPQKMENDSKIVSQIFLPTKISIFFPKPLYPQKNRKLQIQIPTHKKT